MDRYTAPLSGNGTPEPASPPKELANLLDIHKPGPASWRSGMNS